MDLAPLTIALLSMLVFFVSIIASILFAQRQIARVAKEEIQAGAKRYELEVDRDLRSGRDVVV